MATFKFFLVLSVLCLSVEGQSSGYERVRGNKYAKIFHGEITWPAALRNCKQEGNGGTLFIVNNGADSTWLGRRINVEKDNRSGSSKFWVGLKSLSSNGPLRWLDGTGYRKHPETVKADGYEDSEKQFAWAVPDSGVRIKYEFQTNDDEGESYICQKYL